jgi:hypothetical protein
VDLIKAGYDRVGKCLDGTREALLGEILQLLRSMGPEDARVIWMYGMAGTGKSTIAATVAHSLDDAQYLGGSFFFSRHGAAEQTNPEIVFGALARELAIRVPRVSEEITNTLKVYTDIGSAAISTQFSKLILAPVRSSKGLCLPIVVVLDALDECPSPSMILSVIAEGISQLPSQFKLVITSRPEPDIRDIFNTMSASVRKIPLSHNDNVDRDIAKLVSESTSRLARRYQLPSDWPGDETRNTLVRMAGGLFVWISTVIKFIEDEDVDDPEAQLKIILETNSSPLSGTSPWTHLDSLYLHVLHNAFSEKAPQKRLQLFQQVAGAMVILRNPIPASALGTLLSLGDTPKSASRVVTNVLRKLQSVFSVPSKTSEPLRVIHPSFFDFITNGERCNDDRFVVDVQKQHRALACQCLRLMYRLLKMNICSVDPWLLNSNVDNFDDRITQCIPKALQYACRFWTDHLSLVTPDAELYALVRTFYFNDMLCWLEVSSLLGAFEGSMHSLSAARMWILVCLFSLLSSTDGAKFVRSVGLRECRRAAACYRQRQQTFRT